MSNAIYAATIVLCMFAVDAVACSVTPEFGNLSSADRAKLLYDRLAVVARVKVKDISTSPPRLARVETVESFKGAPVAGIYEDMSTCGFPIKADQDFIVFIPNDFAVLSVNNIIPSPEYEQVIPILRRLQANK